MGHGFMGGAPNDPSGFCLSPVCQSSIRKRIGVRYETDFNVFVTTLRERGMVRLILPSSVMLKCFLPRYPDGHPMSNWNYHPNSTYDGSRTSVTMSILPLNQCDSLGVSRTHHIGLFWESRNIILLRHQYVQYTKSIIQYEVVIMPHANKHGNKIHRQHLLI
jgi:hypothetical protein